MITVLSAPSYRHSTGFHLNDEVRADDPADPKRYREAGHIVIDGTLGRHPVKVVITQYALRRMRSRDIHEAELLQALALHPSSHGRGKTEGRFEVAGMTDRGRIRVIYERPARDIALVITTYPESD